MKLNELHVTRPVHYVQKAAAVASNTWWQARTSLSLHHSSTQFGNELAHNSCNWMIVIEDSGEHFGQLVV